MSLRGPGLLSASGITKWLRILLVVSYPPGDLRAIFATGGCMDVA